jgi:threonine/homoserine/homoserine lactone efflux protein
MGIVPHLTASILGLSAILHLSAQAFQIIKWAGAVYLLYLAWGMWRDQGSLKLDNTTSKVNGFQIIIKGILINLLNPKLTLFFLAFLPLFISPEIGSPTKQMLRLSAIFMAMTLVIFALYGLLASVISKYLTNSPKIIRWLQRSFALVFAVLAVKLALSEQS